MNNKPNRICYFDFLRGIAILMVLGIHSYPNKGLEGSGAFFQMGMRESLDFAVPLFLAISGFFTGKNHLDDKNSYLKFLKKQIPRVYIPALLWSVPILVLWLYEGHGAMRSFFNVFLCMSFVPYYYILLIIQFYLILPLVKRLTYRKWGGYL